MHLCFQLHEQILIDFFWHRFILYIVIFGEIYSITLIINLSYKIEGHEVVMATTWISDYDLNLMCVYLKYFQSSPYEPSFSYVSVRLMFSYSNLNKEDFIEL